MTSTTLPRPTLSIPPFTRPLLVLLILNLLLTLLLALVRPLALTIPSTTQPGATPALAYARTDSNIFIENRGQFDAELVAMMLSREASLAVERNGRLHVYVNGAPPLTLSFNVDGSGTTPQVSLYGPLATTVSFLTGNDTSRWQTGVPVWEAVHVTLTPGLMLELTVTEQRLRIRAITDEPAMLDRVEMQVSGGDVIGLTDGELAVQAGNQRLLLPLLEAVTRTDTPHHLSITPVIEGDGIVKAPIGTSFGNGEYNSPAPAQTSVATMLATSTFLGEPGRSGSDLGKAISVDANGNVYVTGHTGSSNFPTTSGAFDTSHNDNDSFRGNIYDDGDVFVSKISNDLTTLVASTLIGGSEGDTGTAITVDSQGNVYVTGWTGSGNFPITSGVYDNTHNGPGTADVFVAKLSNNLSNLIASTFIGKEGFDIANDLALDNQGNVYVTGMTGVTGFPTTPGSYDGSSSDNDAFISKLNNNLTSLIASTVLGGSELDEAFGIVIDSLGSIYVAGQTSSADFPTTSGSYDTVYDGGTPFYGGDGFISKLSNDLTTLSSSTFIGVSDSEYVFDIAIDGQNNIYVVGSTRSYDFPTTSGAYDRFYNGGFNDAFVSKLSSNLSSLAASTLLGGLNTDEAKTLILDTQNNIYVAGKTDSSNFPTTSGAYNTTHNGGSDGFVSKLSNDLTLLAISTFLGGSNDDEISNITLDDQGNVYVTGETRSNNFPTTEGAFEIYYMGTGNYAGDAFASKISSNLSALLASTILGGSGDDVANTIAIDDQNNVYIAGYTENKGFPTSSTSYDHTSNGYFDAFVAKLSSDLTNLMAGTFLGGSGSEIIDAITLDSQGNVYVAGRTVSNDFPSTTGAYDISFDNILDIFISKLNDNLTNLLASTFLGGSNFDTVKDVVVDNQGNVYVAGYTTSTDFPTITGAFDISHNGGVDSFVSKLDENLSALLASTFLGGSGNDRSTAITLDSQGSVYAVGYTYSNNFPTASGAFDTSYDGSSDIFISKLNSNLASLEAGTFLGGQDSDFAYALGVDADDNLYIAGDTWSAGFPLTTGAYDTSPNGSNDAFILKFDNNLSNPIASSLLGGDGGEYVVAMHVDSQGKVFVTGNTSSTNFPITPGVPDASHNGGDDVFVSVLNDDLSSLSFSTFLGSSGTDMAFGLTVDTQSNIFVAGWTDSADFPTNNGTYDPSYNGARDVFVSKLTPGYLVFLPQIVR